MQPKPDTQEQALFQCALRVEQDKALNTEMKDWDITLADGISTYLQSIFSTARPCPPGRE